MKDNKDGKTMLTIQIGDRISTVEMSGIDPTVEDMLESFYGAMVSQTFLPCSVISTMLDFAEERTDFTTNTKETEETV